MEVITTHLESDFDGLASMVAAQKLYPNAILAVPGGCQPSVRTFLQSHPIPLTSPKQIQAAQVTRLILVDTQDPDRIGPLRQVLENPNTSIHVFDHHPPDLGETPLIHADFQLVESVGATITLLVEQLLHQKITLTPFEATLFALGLYEETGSFLYPHTTTRDMNIAAVLLEADADLNLVANFIQRDFTAPQIEILNAMIQASTVVYLARRRILLTILSWPRYVEDLAPIIQQIAKIKEVDAIFAAVEMEGKIQFIGRCRQKEIDANQIAAAFGGGGHTMAAAASIKGLTLPEVDFRIRHLLEEQAKSWLQIANLMTSPVKTVSMGTKVQDTERLMTKYQVNALPVVDIRGTFVGLVTRETIQKALFHRFHSTPTDNIMQQDIYTAIPHTPFEDVRIQMIERNQRVVPILKNRRVIGIFSRTDLLRVFHEDMVEHSPEGSTQTFKTNIKEPLHRRNLKEFIAARLPKNVQLLLKTIGTIADQLDISAYVVGGFVRDLILEIPNTDVDIVIEGDGIRFGKILASKLKASVKVHGKFGTASIIPPANFGLPKDLTIDIATARTEYYEYPTALPTVERSSIKKDLFRRDFTINTLAIRLNGRSGELLDFFGGRQDLKAKTIRVLHSLSFVEDPTRIFRAVRFEQRFGFKISKETMYFIRNAVQLELFHRLSRHRLGTEVMLLLSEPKPGKGLRRLQEIGLLPFIHPHLAWNDQVERHFQSAEKILAWQNLEFPDEPIQTWLVYAIALFDRFELTELQKCWKQLGWPEGHTKTIAAFMKKQNQLLRKLSSKALNPATIYDLLQSCPIETLLFLMAKAQEKPTRNIVLKRIKNFLVNLRQVKAFVTGHDLEMLKLRKGPAYRKILDHILTARLNGQVQTKPEELALAQTLVSQVQPSTKRSSKQ